MSQKRKRGLQRGLSEIVEAQTAPPVEKSQLSRGLIDKFAERPEAQSPPPPSGGQTPSAPLPTTPIAPARNFNRRANSIDLSALPAGLFPGSSQKLYNALYVRTRGAVVPTRTVRATKRELAQWSGVKNRKTLDGHMRYFATCRLIVRQWELGNNEGYLFEVNLPEEVGLMDRGGQTPLRPLDPSDPKTERGTDQKRATGGQSKVVDNADTSAPLQTSFKTKDQNTDDEACADLIAKLQQAALQLTGRGLSAAERTKWGELADLLVAELQIAAARTGQVSSVPAFLTEHLRRRLWKKDKAQLDREEANAPELKQEIDASKCPDCGGSGWWYPEGPEKGVAKCRHTKVSPP